MTLEPREIAGRADFDAVARRLAAGEDLTVVEPRYADLWRNPARYPTAVTLAAMPSADAIGLMIVPFLDVLGEPGDEDFTYYAGVVYLLALEDTVFSFREYQQDEGPFEAWLHGFSATRPVGHHEWRLSCMVPYEDPAFVRAARLLWDRYAVREVKVLIDRGGYEPVDTGRLFSLDVRPAGGTGAVIRFYRVSDRYGCFSNFAPYPVRLDRVVWPTSEHYFQAQKLSDEAAREAIRLTADSPMEAARMGRSRGQPLRPDWEAVKVDVMRGAVWAKFSQHPDLGRTLLATGNATLVEHTPRDAFWGDGGDGRGRNMLGRILVEVRGRLRVEAGALAEAPKALRAPLVSLLGWFALGVPREPNAWWRGKLAARLASLDRGALRDWLAPRLPRFAETVSPGEISASALLGLVHAAGALDDEALVPALATVLETAWAAGPDQHVRAPSVGAACVPILARFPSGRARLRALESRLEPPELRQLIESALASSGG